MNPRVTRRSPMLPVEIRELSRLAGESEIKTACDLLRSEPKALEVLRMNEGLAVLIAAAAKMARGCGVAGCWRCADAELRAHRAVAGVLLGGHRVEEGRARDAAAVLMLDVLDVPRA